MKIRIFWSQFFLALVKSKENKENIIKIFGFYKSQKKLTPKTSNFHSADLSNIKQSKKTNKIAKCKTEKIPAIRKKNQSLNVACNLADVVIATKDWRKGYISNQLQSKDGHLDLVRSGQLQHL